MSEQDIAARFARDTASHQVIVAHDDGLYRHLQFRNPEHSWCYWFDLVTVPGALIFQGDGESFVFRRLDDMFAFFRGSAWQGQPNVSYWAEKLTDGRDRVMVYQQDYLERHVNDAVAEAVKDNPKLSGLPDAVRGHVLDKFCDDEAYDRRLVDNFSFFIDERDEWAVPSKPADFTFGETFEWNCRDYHWWFLWALHAILWGIGQYDAPRQAVAS